jgi:hypothetical protein
VLRRQSTLKNQLYTRLPTRRTIRNHRNTPAQRTPHTSTATFFPMSADELRCRCEIYFVLACSGDRDTDDLGSPRFSRTRQWERPHHRLITPPSSRLGRFSIHYVRQSQPNNLCQRRKPSQMHTRFKSPKTPRKLQHLPPPRRPRKFPEKGPSPVLSL